MPSADFCAAFGGSPPSRHSDHKGHGRQQRRPPEVSLTAFRTPPPNLRRARLMDMDFAASRPLVPRPPPLIRFLCIGACVCSTLPSDPTSRLATPLRFANLHLHQVGRGLSPPSCQTCSAHGIARCVPRAGGDASPCETPAKLRGSLYAPEDEARSLDFARDDGLVSTFVQCGGSNGPMRITKIGDGVIDITAARRFVAGRIH